MFLSFISMNITAATMTTRSSRIKSATIIQIQKGGPPQNEPRRHENNAASIPEDEPSREKVIVVPVDWRFFVSSLQEKTQHTVASS